MTEAIGRVDERNPRLARGALVAVGIAQVKGGGISDAVQQQANAAAFVQPRRARAGVSGKAVVQPAEIKEQLDISRLTIADDVQIIGAAEHAPPSLRR